MDRRLRNTKTIAVAITLALAVAACETDDTDPTDPADPLDPAVTTTIGLDTTTVPTTAAG